MHLMKRYLFEISYKRVLKRLLRIYDFAHGS